MLPSGLYEVAEQHHGDLLDGSAVQFHQPLNLLRQQFDASLRHFDAVRLRVLASCQSPTRHTSVSASPFLPDAFGFGTGGIVMLSAASFAA